MEDITCWRIINNYGIFQISVYSCQILHVNALVMSAFFSKQSMRNQALWVEPIKQWVSVFSKRSSVNDEFIPLSCLYQELIHSRSFCHEDFAKTVIDLNRQDQVTMLHSVKTWMNKSFIKVEHKGLLTSIWRLLFSTNNSKPLIVIRFFLRSKN